MASEYHVSSEARQAYAALTPALKRWYLYNGHGLSENELFQAVEKNFGAQLEKDICPQLGITAGACIVVAMELMRESIELTPAGTIR